MLDRLQVFRTVAEKGSFSKAAECLHLSQPTISLHIQALEEHYGAKLFDRTTKRVRLTAAGEILLEYARHILDLYQRSEHEVSQVARTVQGRLRVGASLTVGEYVLPRVAGLFVRQNPRTVVSLSLGNTEHVVQWVLEGEMDVGLVEAPLNHPDLEVTGFMQDELVVVVPYGHPWAERRAIQAEWLARYPLIVREKGSGTRRVMEDGLQAAGVRLADLNVLMELGSTQAIKEAVEAGLGYAIISRCAIRKEEEFRLLRGVRISNVALTREFQVTTSKRKFRSAAAEAFIQFLCGGG